MKTPAQQELAALLEAIAAAEPGERPEDVPWSNCFDRGVVRINTDEAACYDDPVYRNMTPAELEQEAAVIAWGEKNRRHYDLTEKVDATAKAAFDSLPQEAQVAFLESGPHRWAGGEDARFARFKVVLAHGSTEVARLGATGNSTDARILISAAPHGAETEKLIARLAQFEF
jgi:hypothetical protein